jgi:hypothetical protein
MNVNRFSELQLTCFQSKTKDLQVIDSFTFNDGIDKRADQSIYALNIILTLRATLLHRRSDFQLNLICKVQCGYLRGGGRRRVNSIVSMKNVCFFYFETFLKRLREL